MFFSGTDESRALANATISRLKADARMESTRATLFKVGGYGAFLVCLGLGCGMTLLGFSSIKKAQSSSEEIAMTLATALSKTPLTITGEVELAPEATIILGPAQIVALDPDATVKIELDSTVHNQSTRPHLDPRVSRTQPISGGSVATRFTVFQEVKYSKGAVITSWTFSSNERATPNRQRCYYIERADQALASAVTKLAVNGKTVSQPQRSQIDTEAAATNCVWFSQQGGV